MKYIGYYTLQADYQGEFSRERIEEMHETEFLEVLNNLKDWHPSAINRIFADFLKAFPENKFHWINRTLLLIEKYRHQIPESHYEVLHTWLIGLTDPAYCQALEGNAAEIVRQKKEYIRRQRRKRKLTDIMDDLAYWYNVPKANLLKAYSRP